MLKMLISSNIINKFKNCVSDEEYKTGWKKLQAYQEQAELIRSYKETEFQSEFLSTIFGDILGYIPRTKSIKEANLIVEKKIEEGQKFIDGAIIGKDGRSRIVIELKDTKSIDLLKSKGGKGGLHSLAPIQQASIYLFSEPLADLAVVSNFDNLIIFDKKEKYRQEFSLFDMNFEEFQEFYLILCSKNYWSGLTQMMVKQSTEQEKGIDDEFFIKVKTLNEILKNTMKEENANDLFNKFLALAILEDNGRLPTNLINSIHSMKDDFTHSHNHWGVWSEFFRSMKKHKPGKELMGIDPSITALDIWQDVSYLGRTKVKKSTLDLVVEISKYDLFSIPMQKLFYQIAVKIDSPYDTVLAEDPFEFYSELLSDDKFTGCDQAASFVTLKTYDDNKPLIKLFNQISENKVTTKKDGVKFAIAPQPEMDDYWIVIDRSDLDEVNTVSLIKEKGLALKLYESKVEPNYNFVLVNLTSFGLDKKASEDIPLYIEFNENKIELDRKKIKDRIIILTEEEQKWLNENVSDSKPLKQYATMAKEKDADLRFNLDTKVVSRKDSETGRWEVVNDFVLDEENFLYLKVKNDDVLYFLESSDFSKIMELVSWDKTTFLDLPVPDKLTKKSWLSKAKEYRKLKETIRLYEFKLEKQQEKGAELEILKTEEILDSLYEEQSEFEWN